MVEKLHHKDEYLYFANLITASSSDFDEGTQVVSFSSRQTKAVVYIRIYDDDKVEGTEGFKVELLLPRTSRNSEVRSGRWSFATCYILSGERSDTFY